MLSRITSSRTQLATTSSMPLTAIPRAALMIPTTTTPTIVHHPAHRKCDQMVIGRRLVKGTKFANCEVRYASVAAFNSETGFEAHGLAIDNVATNPFFANEANGVLGSRWAAGGLDAVHHCNRRCCCWVPAGVNLDLGRFKLRYTEQRCLNQFAC